MAFSDGLIVASGFLIGSLSVVLVIYRLQWGHFDKKTPGQKEVARCDTLWMFRIERAYVEFVLVGLFVNLLALLWDFSPVAYAAITISGIGGAWFFWIVYYEIGTSIRHIVNRRWLTEPPSNPCPDTTPDQTVSPPKAN